MTFILKRLDANALKCHDLSARECLKSCDQGFYVNKKKEQVPLTDLINNCLEKTEFYEDNHVFNLPPLENKESGIIEIRNESTLQATYRMVVKENKKNVCALNFANAFTPGGGVLYGARAQEETLCRASALYYSITQEKPSQFYEYHSDNYEKFGDAASNAMIYTPDCPTWKVDNVTLDEPYLTSYITSAAVDNTGRLPRGKIKAIHDERIKQIINCAIVNGVKNFVLGAFGCGAFYNDPVDVSQSFKKYLVDDEKRFYFESISFSIIGFNTKNIDAFAKTFELPIILKE